MRILMINICCGTGSTGRICTDLAARLEEAGHEVKIAYARDGLPEWAEKYAVRIGTTADVLCHAASARLLDNAGFASRRATEKFLRWVREFDPDIIHLHNLHGYYIHVGLLFDYLKQSGKRVIWTLHDGWAMTGHCAHFDFIGCDKWSTTGCFDCPQTREYPACIGADRSKRNFIRKKETFCGVPDMTLVTVSQWLKGVVRQSFLKKYPIEVIPNGIDLQAFKPTNSDALVRRYGLEGKKVILGVAQNWGVKKGLQDMLRLSQLLPADYQVVLVGLTKQQVKDLPSNVIGITRTNDLPELAAFYSLAHVFLNLSVEESMGMTTLEALACGTPAIVYNRTAVPEVVDDSCGWAVNPGDFREILRILGSMGSKELYTKACLARAEKYEKCQQYANYIALYEAT